MYPGSIYPGQYSAFGPSDRGAGASVGSGVAVGVGQAIVTSTGTAVGAGSAAGIGGAAALGAGTAVGVATAVATGLEIAQSTGTAAGAGSAAGVAQYISPSIGTALGVSSASGRTPFGVGTAVGAAVAVASGSGIQAGVGTALGAGIALGVSRPLGVGTAVGAGSASGVSTSVVEIGFPKIFINGIEFPIRCDTLVIYDSVPKRCSFQTVSSTITVDQSILIQVGVGAGGFITLFEGSVVDVEQSIEGSLFNKIFTVTCLGTARKLVRRAVWKTYTEQKAGYIGRDLITNYAPGFTWSYIPIEGPETTIVGGVTFLGQDVEACMTWLANTIGGYFYVEGFDVHLYLTEATEVPDTLDSSNTDIYLDPPLRFSRTSAQLRTRDIATGGGSSTRVNIAAGSAVLPVEDTKSWYSASGKVLVGSQILDYTGKRDGGDGSTVASLAGPGSAPSAALGSGAGGVLGAVRYAAAFKNAQGQTAIGPVSNSVTGVAFAAPTSPSVSLASGLGRIVGTNLNYAITLVTPLGETNLGAISTSVSPLATAPPSAPSISLLSGLGNLVGTFGYKSSIVTPYGETLASGVGSRTAAGTPAPGAPTLSEISSTIGRLIGTLGYKYSDVNALGETLPGSAASITLAAQSAPSGCTANTSGIGPILGTISYKIAIVSAYGETLGSTSGNFTPTIVTASAPTVSGDGTGLEIAYATTYVHPIYGESALSSRTVDTNKGTNPVVSVNGLPSGCGWNVYSTGTVTAGTGSSAPLFKVAEVGIGVGSFTHTTQTGPAEGVVPAMGRGVALTSIPTGPTGTLARRIYRTMGGGSTYLLVGQIDDNTTTSFTDVTPDNALTANAPLGNVNGKQVALTGISNGPAGTIARRIYRTKAGGSAYFFLGQIDDNSTNTFTDNVPDDALKESAPLVATGGGEQHTVTFATGPTGTIARRIYRTESGGSIYKLLAEIADNTTTAFTDNYPDTSLSGTTEPLQNTAGGQNIALSSIPIGPTGTIARRIYRIKNGGTQYFLVDQLSDNTTSTYTDSKLDSELGDPSSSINTAGASTVSVTSIPLGGAGITSRLLYRTEGGGSVYRFLAEILDNTTSVYTDISPDTGLGDPAPASGTIGALPGDTSLKLVSTSTFLSSGGWAQVDSQWIRYTGTGGNTLTGIPSSGDGALATSVKAGVSVINAPMLTGIPPSGTGSITATIPSNTTVSVFEIVDDLAAQAALVTREGGGDGVIEFPLSGNQWTPAMARANGTADLTLFSKPIDNLVYETHDVKTKRGKFVPVNLPGQGAVGNFTIQDVVINEIGTYRGIRPHYVVKASSIRFTFNDILRRVTVGSGEVHP